MYCVTRRPHSCRRAAVGFVLMALTPTVSRLDAQPAPGRITGVLTALHVDNLDDRQSPGHIVVGTRRFSCRETCRSNFPA